MIARIFNAVDLLCIRWCPGLFLPQQWWCRGGLLLQWSGSALWAIEVKRSLTPKVERGFHAACDDLKPTRKPVVYPGIGTYPLGHDILALPLITLCQQLGLASHPSQ
jgi:hypothetical protein